MLQKHSCRQAADRCTLHRGAFEGHNPGTDPGISRFSHLSVATTFTYEEKIHIAHTSFREPWSWTPHMTVSLSKCLSLQISAARYRRGHDRPRPLRLLSVWPSRWSQNVKVFKTDTQKKVWNVNNKRSSIPWRNSYYLFRNSEWVTNESKRLLCQI